MRRWFIRGVIGLAVAAAGVIGVAALLDTDERPPAFDPPGYRVTEIQVPGRTIPVRLHVWYPTESKAEPALLGQNGLFYGAHVRRDAPPSAGSMPVVVMSHGSGGNSERLV